MEGEWEAKPETGDLDEPEEPEEAEVPHEQELLGKPEEKKTEEMEGKHTLSKQLHWIVLDCLGLFFKNKSTANSPIWFCMQLFIYFEFRITSTFIVSST